MTKCDTVTMQITFDGAHFSLESKAINGITFPKPFSFSNILYIHFVNAYDMLILSSSSRLLLLLVFVWFHLVLCILRNRYLLCVCLFIFFISPFLFVWYQEFSTVHIPIFHIILHVGLHRSLMNNIFSSSFNFFFFFKERIFLYLLGFFL